MAYSLAYSLAYSIVYSLAWYIPWHCKFLIKFSDCPCEIGCLDGCDDCPNPVCECEVREKILRFQFLSFLRIWRPMKTGTSASMTMVQLWADASTLVMAMKAVKLIASIVSRSDKPIVHVRYLCKPLPLLLFNIIQMI